MNTPNGYILFHMLIGFMVYFLSKNTKAISVFFILFYQLLQLCLNKRFFPFSFTSKDGNSFEHTINKLGQFCIGYCSVIVSFSINSFVRNEVFL